MTASGVAVLAFATARGHPSRLARHEQLAVVLALAGLVLLALSLTGATASDQRPAVVGAVIWLAACGGGAALLIVVRTRFARAASLGLAAGLLFAVGDISAKLVGYGGLWLVALATLIAAYAVGTSVLQWAYQQGDALTAAGTATMVTNAVPIAAGLPFSATRYRTAGAPPCRSPRSVALLPAPSPLGTRRRAPASRFHALTEPANARPAFESAGATIQMARAPSPDVAGDWRLSGAVLCLDVVPTSPARARQSPGTNVPVDSALPQPANPSF